MVKRQVGAQAKLGEQSLPLSGDKWLHVILEEQYQMSATVLGVLSTVLKVRHTPGRGSTDRFAEDAKLVCAAQWLIQVS